ncbi:S8 family serine peptidase [Rheinheimera sp.]|uniref:S8 family serine peptidase n=1 Tax=Rheinheimera sp. TaxID=1869214 RepID=UPI003D2D1EE4
MARKPLLGIWVGALLSNTVCAAVPDLAAMIATEGMPSGTYRQDLPDGALRLVEPERYLVQLDLPALYPLLEQELRAQQSIQLAPEQVLNHESWQQLRFSQIRAAQARIQNEQQLAKVQIQSRFPRVRVTGQFGQLENALTVSIATANRQQIVEQLAQLPGVKAVYPEQLVRAYLTQSVPKINAPKVWEMQRDGLPIKGTGIRVAVLDSGVDYTHEALGGCFGAGCKVAGGYDFVGNDSDPMDVFGHGTHVASIIAGESATIGGVAQKASIYAYKVLGDNGYGSTFNILAALEKALDPDGNPLTRDGAQIINMSLGHDGRDPQDPVVVAVNNVAKAGVLVVVAAGNSGPNTETIGSPGVAAGALTVANTEKNDQVSYSSSRGPGVAGAWFKPELAAPGSDIYAAIPGNKYAHKSGTSMAAPHVAGAAALLLQAEPELTVAQLKQRLVQNTTPLSENLWDHGTGRLNVLEAMRNSLTTDQDFLYLGRVNAADFSNQGIRRVTVQNTSPQSVEVSLRVKGAPAFLTATLDNSTLNLAAGEAKTIELNYRVDPEKVPADPPAATAYQISLVITNRNEHHYLPVVLEHYYPFQLKLPDSMNSVQIYTPEWHQIAYRFNIWYESAVKLRLTTKVINVLANAVSIPAHLLPEDTRNKIVNRDNWIIRPAVDVVTTPEITVSNSELKHRLRMKAPTRDGQPFWPSENSDMWMQIELKDGEHYIAFHNSYMLCGNRCKESSPPEFYSSDLAPSVALKVQQNLLNVHSNPQTLIINSYRFNTPLQTQDMTLEYKEQDMVRLRKAGSSIYGFNMMAFGNYVRSDAIDLQIWYKTIGLKADEMPDTRINFEKSGPFWADSLSTYPWRLTVDGKLQKFRCKTEPCVATKIADHELIYSSDVRELSFDNHLRYLTSPLQADSRGFQIKPRYAAIDLYSGNNVFNDLWQNDAPTFSQLSVSQLCDGQVSPLAALSANLDPKTEPANFGTKLMQPFDCKDSGILLHYPLDGRDNKGLLGEVRFTQVKAGLESPYFVNLATFNQGGRGDTISRIDNKFSVEVASKQDPVKEFKVLLKTKDGDWKLAYHGYNAGVHQFPLPLRAGEHWLDLRLQVITQSGNQLVNTMPEALRVGASAGGDNDVDSDGILNGSDTDNDNDSIPDSSDAMPYNPTETLDSDQDGLGNNADPDDDNDGVADPTDAFPLDPKETLDTDKDGVGNNADTDDDNDGVADTADAFPLDPKETLDTDKDGIGNNADADDDNDTVADTADAFPLDANETLDTDKDGIGNNADPDDDNDGVADGSDKYPLDASRSSDPVTPNAGSSGGSGGAGLGVLLIVLPLLAWRRKTCLSRPRRDLALDQQMHL